MNINLNAHQSKAYYAGYVDYNVVAKKLDRRLAGLGAAQMVPRGLGDDQHPLGHEAALEPWLHSIWTHFRLVIIFSCQSENNHLDGKSH